MPTGPALIAVLHRQKKAGQRPSRPTSAPAMSSIPGNRLSYDKAGADKKAGEKDVIRVGHNLGGEKELMPFKSLLKSSAPKGKGKAKPKMGSLGASPLTAPHSTSASFSPPGRSASLPRSPKATSAIHGQASIPSLVAASLGVGLATDLGHLSVSPKSGPASPGAKMRSKRGLGTPTKNCPVPKYRNPLQLFRSPKKEEPSPSKYSSLDIPAFRLDDAEEVDMTPTVKIFNKNAKKPKPVSGFTPF